MKRTIVAAALTASFASGVLPSPAIAESQSREASSDFGIGAVAVLANVVYMPVKLTYGVLGGVVGGLTYGLSGGNRDAADAVWVPSLGGDYVLTTGHMTGREEVHFSGVRSESRAIASNDDDEIDTDSGF